MNQNTGYNEEYQEIDLKELFRLLLNNIKLIAIITLIVTVLGTLYAFLLVDDQYTASSTMIVQVEEDGTTTAEYTNLMTAQRITKTLTEIIKSDLLLNTVADNLDLDMSSNTLRNMVSVNNVTDTLVVKVSVTNTDPELSKDIANHILDVLKAISEQYEVLDKVAVLDYAKEPTSPSSPNRPLYLMISMVLGAMLSVGFVFLKEMLDTTFKKPEDVEHILGIRVIGVIPDYDIEKLEGGL